MTTETESRKIHYFAVVALDSGMLTDTKAGILDYGYDCEGCRGKSPGADGGFEDIGELEAHAQAHECVTEHVPELTIPITPELRETVRVLRESRLSAGDGLQDYSVQEIELEDAVIWADEFDDGEPEPSAPALEFRQSDLSASTWFADVAEGRLPHGATRLYIRTGPGRRQGYTLSYMYPAVGERIAPAPYDPSYPTFEAAEAAANRWAATV